MRALTNAMTTEGTGFQILEEQYSEEEGIMARCISEVLGVDELSVHDDFFKIGGNSILAIKLSHQVGKALPVEIKVADIFQHKTASKLAGMLKTTKLDENNVVKDF